MRCAAKNPCILPCSPRSIIATPHLGSSLRQSYSCVRFRARHHGEGIVFEPAVDLDKTGIMQPDQLSVDRGTPVLLLTEEGVRNLLFRRSFFMNRGKPPLPVELFERGC